MKQLINRFDLPRLQNCQLTLAIKVRDICVKHGIPYFLIAGTLLGAVRHQGFIPWDEDLDIGMLRQDYDKFISVAQKELGSEYFVQATETDEHMPFPFAKIRINGTILRELNSHKCLWNAGIFIDIFPFDGVPDNSLYKFVHKYLLKIFSLTLLAKCGFNFNNNNLSYIKKMFFYVVIKPVSMVLPRRVQVIILNYLVRLFSFKITKYITAAGGSYGYKKETIPFSWVAQKTLLSFGGSQFSCPLKWHEYLSNLYGDYLKFPPMEKRYNRHNIVELKFKD